MKRLFIIAGIIVVILVVFLGLITLKMRSSDPEILLKKLRRGKGDVEELKMQLGLVRGDIAPMIIKAFEDDSADIDFRVDVLELMFRNYRRSSDERLLPVLQSALKNSETSIRKMAIDGFKVYGSKEQRLLLIDCIDDPDEDIRREVLSLLATSPVGYRMGKDFRENMTEEQQAELIKNCLVKMKTETSPDLRFLARAVIGYKIAWLCRKATESTGSADYEKGEKLLMEALELDPQNHRARIKLVRHLLAADLKSKALEYADKYGAVVHAPLLSKAPVIDGDPTDDVWQQAFRYVDKPFYQVTSWWAPKETEGKTDLYIAHHDGTVYIAVLGYEDDLDELIVKHKGHDSDVWRDDCVELHFDPGNDGSGYAQFVINAVGALYDASVKGKSKNYMSKQAARIFHDRGYWSCEFAISAKALNNSKITADTIWGFDVMRSRIGPASEMCAFWPTFGAARFYNLYPILVFDGLEKSDAAANTSEVK